MKLLQELLELPQQLVEAAAAEITKHGPVEIKDVIAHFPSKYKKVLQVLWGTHRLTYKGQQLFTGRESSMDDTAADLGPVYMGAIHAAEKAMKKMTVPVDIQGMPDVLLNDENVRRKHGNLESEIESEIDESQECYLGYDPKHDQLYIGFDCWLNDEAYNEFANQFDDSNPEIEKALNKVWKEFNEKKFQGELFKLTSSDGKNFKAEEDDSVSGPGGFYKAVYKSPGFKRLGLVDLRLD